MATQNGSFEIKLPYGQGFILVSSLDKVDPENITVETTWRIPENLQLHLADHFPAPNKPVLPGIIQLELIAETLGLPRFRIAEIRETNLSKRVSPGETTVAIQLVGNEEPETEVDQEVHQISGTVTNSLDMVTCEVGLMALETTETPSMFLLADNLAGLETVFNYSGNEVVAVPGPYLPNSLLTEHMCQTSILINSFLPEHQDKQFWLRKIYEATFFSDVQLGDTVRSRAKVTINDDNRGGKASIVCFIDDAPIAAMDLDFAIVRMKKNPSL